MFKLNVPWRHYSYLAVDFFSLTLEISITSKFFFQSVLFARFTCINLYQRTDNPLQDFNVYGIIMSMTDPGGM